MAVGEIITCTGPEDLYRKAEDLLRHGIKTVFVARNTLKIVSVPADKVGASNISVLKQKTLSIA
jgi:hypothetical protein